MPRSEVYSPVDVTVPHFKKLEEGEQLKLFSVTKNRM